MYEVEYCTATGGDPELQTKVVPDHASALDFARFVLPYDVRDGVIVTPVILVDGDWEWGGESEFIGDAGLSS